MTNKQAPAPAPLAVPVGMALVPVDPTDAMRIAGGIALESSPAHDVIGPLVDAWAAMLAAAPTVALAAAQAPAVKAEQMRMPCICEFPDPKNCGVPCERQPNTPVQGSQS